MDIDKEKIVSLLEDGKTQAEIARIFNTSQSTMGRWIRGFGLKSQNHKCGCGEVDPDNFSRGRFTECKKCRSSRQNYLYIKYKQEAVDYKGGECVKCGYNKCLMSLDFHHIDPSTKSPDWKKMRHRPLRKIKDELDKCILVCRNCHGEIHAELSKNRDKLFGVVAEID